MKLGRSLFPCLLIAAAAALPLCARADTAEFTIADDAAMNAIVAQARTDYLATKPFTRLDFAIVVPKGDGTWLRGSFNPATISYPASCVKLAYLAAAMVWCRTNSHPYTYLDASVRPMIEVSSNYDTGVVVDAITGAPNLPSVTSSADAAFAPWYAKRLCTENYLSGRGLLENQTILNKTYPTNSGSSPAGAEAVVVNTTRGGNRMQARCAASLMMEIAKGRIEPGATTYMTGLLAHDRWGDNTSVGPGVPPGSVFHNKIGVAYDTLEDIVHVVMPNGKEFFLAAFSNAYVSPYTSNPYPYDANCLGEFCELLVERLGLDAGNPPKLVMENGAAGFTTSGAWTTGTSATNKHGASYAYKTADGTGSATWNLAVPVAGRYEVCVWYPQGTNRATDARFTVTHAGGSATVQVNQQQNGGLWVRLGDYQFAAGGGTVTLAATSSNATRIVVADAIRAWMWPDLSAVTEWQGY
jgi:hypothetical protein